MQLVRQSNNQPSLSFYFILVVTDVLLYYGSIVTARFPVICCTHTWASNSVFTQDQPTMRRCDMSSVVSVYSKLRLHRRLTWFVSGVMAICLLLSWYPKQDAEVRAQEKSAIVPGKTWAHIEKPESIGYSSERLQALRAWLQ